MPQNNFETFSTELCKKFEPVLKSRSTLSTNRDRMWQNFFILQSSNGFVQNWKTFLHVACLSEPPVFYQHMTDLVFRALIRLHCARPAAQDGESFPTCMSTTEANALRYTCMQLVTSAATSLENFASQKLQTAKICFIV